MTEYLQHGLNFLAIAAILAALVAWNIPSAGSVSDDLPFFLHAFVHSQLPSGLIRNLFRLACLVNSSVRFPNS